MTTQAIDNDVSVHVRVGDTHTLMTRLSERRISPEVIRTFDIKGYGTGWLYSCPNGAQRWKNANQNTEAKYTWIGDKRASLLYHPVTLMDAVNQTGGVIWLTTEFDFFAMQSAGILNVIAQVQAETGVPSDLADTLQSLGVLACQIAPDRDKTGLRWAQKVVNALVPFGIDVIVRELPAPFTEKHGYDLGEAWRTHTGALPFATWLSLLPTTQPKPEPAPTIKLNRADFTGFPMRDTNPVPLSYRMAAAGALGVSKFNKRGYSQPMRCIFHDDQTPSAALHNEYGLKCFVCGWHTWKELGERLNLGRWEYEDEQPVLTDTVCLSEEAAAELVRLGATSLVRLFSLAYRAGWQAGKTFTRKDVLALGLSDWTTRRALELVCVGKCGDISLLLNTPQKPTQTSEGKPAKEYRLPSPAEINEALHVKAMHYTPIDGSAAPAEIRAMLYKKPIERRPGKYARKFLCKPMGIHPNTARNYDKRAELIVTPDVLREELTDPEELPEEWTRAPEHLEVNGKNFAPTKAGYERALKHANGAPIEKVTRRANWYATRKG